MLSENTYLPFQIDWVDMLDQRTINALNCNANIYLVWELLNFCLTGNYERKLSSIKGIWKNGIIRINKLLDTLRNKWIEPHKNELLSESYTDNMVKIDSNIYESNLNLYSSYLSVRTINALNRVWINNVAQLFENKGIYLSWISWLWKAWLREINSLSNYIVNNFSVKNVEIEINNMNLSELISNERILQILNFNWIHRVSELEKYINNKEKFLELRYLSNKDYETLKDAYRGVFSSTERKLSFSDKFINVLENLSEDEKVILNDRILWDKTLVELGEKLWITRERVRQKQKIIEGIIQDNSELIINQNQELLLKIQNTIKIHDYIFLPNEVNLLDYLGFSKENSTLLYLFLKWLNWIKWEDIDNRIYCILKSDNILGSEDLTNIYLYINKKLKNNNDDILMEDLFYELILEGVLSKNIDYKTHKEEVVNYIKKLSDIHEDYVVKWDIIHRFNKKYKLEDYIELILVNFPDWLHYSELNKILKKDYNLDYTDTQILNWLWHYGFKNIWLGTYTLNSNNNYSWWKTWDIIYLYLKDEWEPKTLKDITNHVLSRKRINGWTVTAAISWYKNEVRFVFYNDWKIWLKEWNLWNVRRKREISKYEISLSKAYEELLKKNLIPNTFYIDDIRKLLENNFWNKVSKNTSAIWLILAKQVEKWSLMLEKTNFRYIYSLK